nr:ABC transporter ATP-binding protein [Anaerolineae bacterium]
MSEIVIQVDGVVKSFGKQGEPIWKQIARKLRKPAVNGCQPDPAETSLTPNGRKPAVQEDSNGNGDQKQIVAVNRLSFAVHKGEIFGVLGPNGSGKSTLIRLMSTLLLPDKGQITILGYDIVKDSFTVQKLINRVSVEASFFKKLSPMENLIYGARLYGMEGRETRKQIVTILTRLGLEKRAIYGPMEEMSRGMQQKVAIARALLTRPRILLLDEPTTGLDPRSKLEVQAVVREMRDNFGVTIILTTHDMVEADKLCSRIAILDHGDIVALDTPEKLREMVPSENGRETTLEDVFLALTGREFDPEAEVSETLDDIGAVLSEVTEESEETAILAA